MTQYIKTFLEIEPHHMGKFLHVPVCLPYTEQLINVSETDIYERRTVAKGDLRCELWVFMKRVKEYMEPHKSQEEFDQCDWCLTSGRVFNEVPETVILIESGWD